MHRYRHAARPVVFLAIAVAAGMLMIGCGGQSQAPAPTADVAAGQRAFDMTCAACHGPSGRGTAQGPAFVDRTYEPSHHADAAFAIAVRQGVVAHHWSFGDMPPQPDVSATELTEIVAYVRALQVAAGIT